MSHLIYHHHLHIGLYPVVVYYNARQDNTIQYSTIQYSTIKQFTQNNVHHTELYKTLKATLNTQNYKKFNNTYYTLLRFRNEKNLK
jgi:hypothetical protein